MPVVRHRGEEHPVEPGVLAARRRVPLLVVHHAFHSTTRARRALAEIGHQQGGDGNPHTGTARAYYADRCDTSPRPPCRWLAIAALAVLLAATATGTISAHGRSPPRPARRVPSSRSLPAAMTAAAARCRSRARSSASTQVTTAATTTNPPSSPSRCGTAGSGRTATPRAPQTDWAHTFTEALFNWHVAEIPQGRPAQGRRQGRHDPADQQRQRSVRGQARVHHSTAPRQRRGGHPRGRRLLRRLPRLRAARAGRRRAERQGDPLVAHLRRGHQGGHARAHEDAGQQLRRHERHQLPRRPRRPEPHQASRRSSSRSAT